MRSRLIPLLILFLVYSPALYARDLPNLTFENSDFAESIFSYQPTTYEGEPKLTISFFNRKLTAKERQAMIAEGSTTGWNNLSKLFNTPLNRAWIGSIRLLFDKEENLCKKEHITHGYFTFPLEQGPLHDYFKKHKKLYSSKSRYGHKFTKEQAQSIVRELSCSYDKTTPAKLSIAENVPAQKQYRKPPLSLDIKTTGKFLFLHSVKDWKKPKPVEQAPEEPIVVKRKPQFNNRTTPNIVSQVELNQKDPSNSKLVIAFYRNEFNDNVAIRQLKGKIERNRRLSPLAQLSASAILFINIDLQREKIDKHAIKNLNFKIFRSGQLIPEAVISTSIASELQKIFKKFELNIDKGTFLLDMSYDRFMNHSGTLYQFNYRLKQPFDSAYIHDGDK